jgi:hypothetical protein
MAKVCPTASTAVRLRLAGAADAVYVAGDASNACLHRSEQKEYVVP